MDPLEEYVKIVMTSVREPKDCYKGEAYGPRAPLQEHDGYFLTQLFIGRKKQMRREGILHAEAYTLFVGGLLLCHILSYNIVQKEIV